MLIRIQSANGTKRIEVKETDSLSKLFDLTASALELDANADWHLSKSRNLNDAFRRQSRSLVKSAKLKYVYFGFFSYLIIALM